MTIRTGRTNRSRHKHATAIREQIREARSPPAQFVGVNFSHSLCNSINSAFQAFLLRIEHAFILSTTEDVVEVTEAIIQKGTGGT